MPSNTDAASTWANALALSPLQERVLAEVFWQLLAGKPVPAAGLSSALGLSAEGVEETLAALEAKRSLRRDETGAIVAARGLMISPSSHRLTTQPGSIFTQCAVDAVGIPAALGLEATVEDQCARCGSPIEAIVRRSGDVAVHPATAVIVMAQPDSRVEEGIPRVCRETNFFCSREHAEAWQREQATLPSAVTTPADAALVGRVIWGRFTRQRREQ